MNTKNSLPWLILALSATFALTGCAPCYSPEPAIANERRITRASVDEQARQGVLVQRSIYPWHFLPGTAELNEIGRRDVAMMAAADREAPAGLILREPAGGKLAQARMQAVRQELTRIDAGQVNVSAGWPGGDGINAEGAALRYRAAELRASPEKGEPGPMTFMPLTPAGSQSAPPK